jgi:hypothetical protein
MTDIPVRRGPKPRTTDTNPHEQLDQNAPKEMQAALLYRAGKQLQDAVWSRSGVSVPGARALLLAPERGGPPDAFMVGREFAHFHPPYDGSLHLTLPQPIRDQALAGGWVEPHPLAGRDGLPDTVVMLYGPRDTEELEMAWWLLSCSHAFASGATA